MGGQRDRFQAPAAAGSALAVRCSRLSGDSGEPSGPCGPRASRGVSLCHVWHRRCSLTPWRVRSCARDRVGALLSCARRERTSSETARLAPPTQEVAHTGSSRGATGPFARPLRDFSHCRSRPPRGRVGTPARWSSASQYAGGLGAIRGGRGFSGPNQGAASPTTRHPGSFPAISKILCEALGAARHARLIGSRAAPDAHALAPTLAPRGASVWHGPCRETAAGAARWIHRRSMDSGD